MNQTSRDQLLRRLLTQTSDIHRTPRCIVRNAADDLGGTFRILAIPIYFSRRTNKFAFAFGTFARKYKPLCILRAERRIDTTHFRNYSPATLDDDGVADANVFSLNL